MISTELNFQLLQKDEKKKSFNQMLTLPPNNVMQ